jgi:hypothetical protein
LKIPLLTNAKSTARNYLASMLNALAREKTGEQRKGVRARWRRCCTNGVLR